jgi:predicted ATP-grasp superfamily ATP-dependent carboligase
MTNVLVTGSGAPGWYSVYKMLKEHNEGINIYGTDLLEKTSGALLCNEHITLPNPANEELFVSELKNFVKSKQINLILPTTDPELLILSKTDFDNCKVAISPYDTLLTATNKKELYSLFPEISPKFQAFSNASEASKLIRNFSDGETCYIKIPVAHGSRGTKKIVSEEEWLTSFEKSKPEQFGGMFPISMLERLKCELLLVEELPGDEYSVDCVFGEDFSLVFYAVRERFKIKNGICDTARFIIDKTGEFKEVLELLQTKLKFKYNTNIQLKRDKGNKLKLLEINPRISGSLGSVHQAGYNLVGMTTDLILRNLSKKQEVTPTSYNNDSAYRVSHFIG